MPPEYLCSSDVQIYIFLLCAQKNPAFGQLLFVVFLLNSVFVYIKLKGSIPIQIAKIFISLCLPFPAAVNAV
jgi:hypothetical protein